MNDAPRPALEEAARRFFETARETALDSLYWATTVLGPHCWPGSLDYTRETLPTDPVEYASFVDEVTNAIALLETLEAIEPPIAHTHAAQQAFVDVVSLARGTGTTSPAPRVGPILCKTAHTAAWALRSALIASPWDLAHRDRETSGEGVARLREEFQNSDPIAQWERWRPILNHWENGSIFRVDFPQLENQIQEEWAACTTTYCTPAPVAWQQEALQKMGLTGPNPPSSPIGSGLYSALDLAEKYGLPPNSLRKRLERWRSENPEGWTEVMDTDRKPRDPQYLYREEAIEAEISKMLKRKGVTRTSHEK